MKTALAAVMKPFYLPRYDQLPPVGLYLEQATQYINQCLQPLGFAETTGSMIRNYVKKGLIDKPENKQYTPHHMAHIIAITVLKHALPLEQIHTLFDLQNASYSVPVAYDYFCMEMENVLQFRFGLKGALTEVGVTDSLLKEILRSAIIAVSHMVYVNTCLRLLSEKEDHK